MKLSNMHPSLARSVTFPHTEKGRDRGCSGQVLSPDPFILARSFAQFYNRYSYCLNNLLNMFDLNGYEYDDDYDNDRDIYDDKYIYDDSFDLHPHLNLIPREQSDFSTDECDEVDYNDFIDETKEAYNPLEEHIEYW